MRRSRRAGEKNGWEKKNGRTEDKDQNIVFPFFFLIIVSINEEYLLFSHLFIYFLCKFTIIFLKSSLNHGIIFLVIYIYIQIF